MPKQRSKAMCTIRMPGTDDLSKLEKARKVVAKLKGVAKTDADHTLQILMVEYDPERITLDKIRETVNLL